MGRLDPSVIRLTGGPPVRGWCTRCWLPSALRFSLSRLEAEGVTPWGTYSQCQDCGAVGSALTWGND